MYFLPSAMRETTLKLAMERWSLSRTTAPPSRDAAADTSRSMQRTSSMRICSVDLIRPALRSSFWYSLRPWRQYGPYGAQSTSEPL